MARTALTAFFSSHDDAVAARDALLGRGFAAADVTVSTDLTSDPVAAEAPGQAYANQATQAGAGLAAWVKSSFTSMTDADTTDAERMADIQRAGATLSVMVEESEARTASALLEAHRAIAVHAG